MIYLDTSFLVSLYCPDGNSQSALSIIQAATGLLLVSTFAEFEFVHALQLRVFRKENRLTQSQTSLAAFEHDTLQGVFQRRSLPQPMFMRARQLSQQTTAQMGTRASDLLHVAAALELGAKRFYTFDRQQAKLAEAMQLKVNP